jgi:hypothetical protein
MNIQQKKEIASSKINQYLDDCCFDIQGLGPSSFSDVAETQLARILTKIAIGSATVWWSVIELKDFIKVRHTLKVKNVSAK